MLRKLMCCFGCHEYDLWDGDECLGDLSGYALAHRMTTMVATLRAPWITCICKHCGKVK